MKISTLIQPLLLAALAFGAQRVLADNELGGVFVSLQS